jgi:hypothetical protein
MTTTVTTMPRQTLVDLVARDTAEMLIRFPGFDLTTFASVTCNLVKPDGSRFSRPVTVNTMDHEQGWVAWEPGDLAVKGRYQAEFEFVRTDGKRFTVPKRYPLWLDVRGDLG